MRYNVKQKLYIYKMNDKEMRGAIGMIETKRLYIIDATEADIEKLLLSWKVIRTIGISSGLQLDEEHKAEIEDKNHLLLVFRRKEDNLIV